MSIAWGVDPYGAVHYSCNTCGKYLGNTADSQLVSLAHECEKDETMVTHDEIARVSKTPEDFGQLDIPDYRESRGSDGRGLRVCGKLRELARDRGFYRHDNPHNELACGLLYGGVAYVMKPDLDECYRNRCTGYVNALLQSFEINYFDKIAIAALVLNEICEPVVGV